MESLSKITRESVIEHYKTYYVPSGEWAGISGDITARDAVAKLDKVLGAWKGGPVAHVTMPFPEADRARRRSISSRGPTPCRRS